MESDPYRVTVAAVLVLFAVVLGCCVESLLFRPPAWNGNKDEFTMLDAGSEKIALLYYRELPVEKSFFTVMETRKT